MASAPKKSDDDDPRTRQFTRSGAWYDTGMKQPPSLMSKDYQEMYDAPNEMGGYRKGGKVKKTGRAKVHKGEQVIRKSSAQKYGPAKMAAVNKGSAKVTTRPKGKR